MREELRKNNVLNALREGNTTYYSAGSQYLVYSGQARFPSAPVGEVIDLRQLQLPQDPSTAGYLIVQTDKQPSGASNFVEELERMSLPYRLASQEAAEHERLRAEAEVAVREVLKEHAEALAVLKKAQARLDEATQQLEEHTARLINAKNRLEEPSEELERSKLATQTLEGMRQVQENIAKLGITE